MGGLTPPEVQKLLRGLRGLELIGADVVEVAPAYDPTRNAAQVAATPLFEMLCVVAESVAKRRDRPGPAAR